MPRSMWRGAIQFGLVTIPVRLFLATETRGGLSFNMLHAEDNTRIQMKVHCPDHGEIKRSDTVRGYEWSKGQYVVLEESDFEAVPLKTVRAIEIEQFVPARRGPGDASFVKQSYYLEPEPVGRKAFELLKSVLAESELQAVCKIVLKDREQLAALDPFGPTMLLSTLYWPDEVRDVGDLDIPEQEFDFKPTEMAMARQLVDTLTGDFDASRYKDEYREALLKVIDSKVAGRAGPGPAARGRDQQVDRPHGRPRGQRRGRACCGQRERRHRERRHRGGGLGAHLGGQGPQASHLQDEECHQGQERQRTRPVRPCPRARAAPSRPRLPVASQPDQRRWGHGAA